MDFIQENLQILATLGSALTLYIFIRIASRKEVREVKEDIKEIKEEIKEIRISISSIDNRLTRLEGRFEERGYWESQLRIIKDKEK